MNSILKQIFKAVFFALVFVVMTYAAYASWIWWSVDSVSNPVDYEHVLKKRWKNAKLVYHFPSQIPAYADAVKFHYQDGFLQGGATIELRYQTSSQFVEPLLKQYRCAAKTIVRGDNEWANADVDIDMLPKWIFHTVERHEIPEDKPFALLPADFEILLLFSCPYRIDPVSWNHGESSGISVSRLRNEVIFWADDW